MNILCNKLRHERLLCFSKLVYFLSILNVMYVVIVTDHTTSSYMFLKDLSQFTFM